MNKQEQNDDYEDEVIAEKEQSEMLKLNGLDENGGYLLGGNKKVKEDEPDPFSMKADEPSQSAIEAD